MARTTATSTCTLTAAELLEQGFTPAEISKLTVLRDNWNPVAEQAHSLLEWRRLQFTKWLYERGHFTEQIPA